MDVSRRGAVLLCRRGCLSRLEPRASVSSHRSELARVHRRHLTASSSRQNAKSTPASARSGTISADEVEFEANDSDGDSAVARSSPPTASTSASASAYLLEQALKEEMEEEMLTRKAPNIPELREKAWEFGPHAEEPQAQALRRILEDQYKPLRIKGYKKAIPQPAPLESRLFTPTKPAAPSESDEKPKNVWDYTFKSPHDLFPSIHTGTFTSATNVMAPRSAPVDRSKRLASALERSWDYGAKKGSVLVPDEGATEGAAQPRSGGRRPMGGMRAWNGLIEDKIEQARQKGQFDKLEGRGKPIPKDENESNPFISRDEFLINRIVQGQGAAPPWVELQVELDSETSNFRTSLRDAWQRRTIRILSLGGVSRTSISDVVSKTYRDAEWEARERSYHETAVTHLNSIVRRYNGIAPYAVRRAPYNLERELEWCFRDSAGPIERELRRRLEGKVEVSKVKEGGGSREVEGKVADKEQEKVDETMWMGLKRLVRQVIGSEPGLMVDRQAPQREAEQRGA